MFPYLVYSTTKVATPNKIKNKDACQKIHSSLEKAEINSGFGLDDVIMAQKPSHGDYFGTTIRGYKTLSEAYELKRNAYAASLKYQCFKNTPPCTESVKYANEYTRFLSVISGQKAKSYAKLRKAQKEIYNSKTESGRHRGYSKRNEALSEIGSSHEITPLPIDLYGYLSKLGIAKKDIKKHCF